MNFTESKAQQLQKEFNIPDTTIKVWKSRNAIPNKYEEVNYKKPEKISSAADLQAFNAIIKVFSYEKINRAAFARLCDIGAVRVEDLLRQKTLPSTHELILIRKNLNLLRNEIKLMLTTLNRKEGVLPEIELTKIKKLFARQEFYWYVLLGRNKVVYDRLWSWVEGRRSDFPEERKLIASSLLIFLTETTI